MPRVHLTPYVETLDAALERAVCDLLGVERAAIRRGREGSFVAIIEGVDEAPLAIELGPAGRRAWITRGELAIGYRGDGGDPMQRPRARAYLETLATRVSSADTERVAAAARAASGLPRMDDRVFRYVAPKEAMIRLGFRCNQDCDFCWQGRSWGEPPVELYRAWVDEMAAAGVRVLHFSGGEPTIHPALPELVARAASLGMEVWLQTNAIQLAKPRVRGELRAVRGIFVSYHSHLPEVSDAMTRAPGTHRRTEAGIAACLEAGMTVELNTLVDSRNVDHLDGLADHVAARFSGIRAINFSHPGIAFDDAEYTAHLAPLDVVGPALISAIRRLEAAKIRSVVGAGCGFPACTFHAAPELAPRVLGESIEEEGGFDRTFVEKCDRCARRSTCIGLRRAYVERLGDRGVVPFREAR